MRRQVFFLRAGDGDLEEVVIERRSSGCRVLRTDGAHDVDVAHLPDGRLSLLFEDGRQMSGRGVARGRDGVDVVTAGNARRVPIGKRRQEPVGGRADSSVAGGIEEVRALMHGRIVEVRVAPGDRVEAGVLLFVLEAMKMQNEIRASRAGAVERVEIAAGQTVEGGAFMVSIRSEKT
jgi:biotin carboxyl carrier protein